MEGPLRFRCPPEFEAVAPASPHGLAGGGGSLGGPSTELWLIRAPADFCPESLEGSAVPLDGSGGQLQPPGAERRLYRLRGGPGGGDGTGGAPLLLAPASPSGPLACAPPLRGCLTITESFGPPPGVPGADAAAPPPPAKRKKKVRTKEATPAAPSEGGGERRPGPPRDGEVPPGEAPARKKKKKKRERERAR